MRKRWGRAVICWSLVFGSALVVINGPASPAAGAAVGTSPLDGLPDCSTTALFPGLLAADDDVAAGADEVTPISLDQLDANDGCVDADGVHQLVGGVHVVRAPDHGLLGSDLSYTPAEGFCGLDSFSYLRRTTLGSVIFDSNVATVWIEVVSSPEHACPPPDGVFLAGFGDPVIWPTRFVMGGPTVGGDARVVRGAGGTVAEILVDAWTRDATTGFDHIEMDLVRVGTVYVGGLRWSSFDQFGEATPVITPFVAWDDHEVWGKVLLHDAFGTHTFLFAVRRGS